jgi:hypothetical protein
VDPAQVDRLIDALNRLGAAQEAWNAQQREQWRSDRAMLEQQKAEYEEKQRQLAAQLGGVPILGGRPG